MKTITWKWVEGTRTYDVWKMGGIPSLRGAIEEFLCQVTEEPRHTGTFYGEKGKGEGYCSTHFVARGRLEEVRFSMYYPASQIELVSHLLWKYSEGKETVCAGIGGYCE